MELIPMIDFVLNKEKDFNAGNIGFKEFTNNVCNYAKLLKQPLTLGMFVPCDDNGKFLKEPKTWKHFTSSPQAFRSLHPEALKLCGEYGKQKERCLFDGFEIRDKGNFYFVEKKNSCIWYRVLKSNTKATIENLLIFKEAKLTQKAIEKL